MDTLVSPHGGKLIPLLAEGEELNKALERDKRLPKITMNSREVSDLIMLAMSVIK